ncbi:hypothetical protein BDV95DRAFT_626998 [Massariosphaeria phaeospora]|uniref:Microtubule associated protein n=1 Tax=Massariosphaeria phaeospora TaxID=100035 RepID=A0A7C8MBR5_9PLEO|nr:hypothetical protein BDV95DRAFT_626998 [Massariosphaeria phaeospora]
MSNPTSPPRNTIGAKVRGPFGFKKTYNFVLWFIFAGALLGFVLARFMYLNFNQFCPPSRISNGNNAAPGECYYYTNFNQYKIGILLHLGGVLPSGLLAVLQFTPAIRQRFVLFHRINGYAVLLLFLLSTVGALMIARHAFGGGLDVQALVGTLAIMCTVSFVLSYINVKRLQIEQHRAWMLRGWFYAGSIITSRFIFILAALIVSKLGGYYTARSCAQLAYIHKTAAETLAHYPACEVFFNGSNLDAQATVKATMTGGSASEVGAVLGMSFGMGLWVSLALHAIGIEIYLHLTPREAERLRNVSYQRQLEAGMQNPGSAGLVVDRFGDCEPWVSQAKKESDAASSK